MVILPLLLRPPDLVLADTTNDFSGTFVVISELSAPTLKRVPGVTGLNLFTAISILYTAIKIYCLTVFQRNNRFFIRCRTATYRSGFCITTFKFSDVSHCIYSLDIYTIHGFNGRFDLNFVSSWINYKSITVKLLS